MRIFLLATLTLNAQWPFIICLAIFEVGSVLCGAAKSSVMLIVGRAVAGIGGSGLLNGALIILNASVAPHRQPGMSRRLYQDTQQNTDEPILQRFWGF